MDDFDDGETFHAQHDHDPSPYHGDYSEGDEDPSDAFIDGLDAAESAAEFDANQDY